MDEIIFNPALCRGCGACVTACAAGLVALERGCPRRGSPERCRECFHCVDACPTGAAGVAGFLHEIAAADNPLLSRRSCRSYTADPVDRAVLGSLGRPSRPGSPPEPAEGATLRLREGAESARGAAHSELSSVIHKTSRIFRVMASLPFFRENPGRNSADSAIYSCLPPAG